MPKVIYFLVEIKKPSGVTVAELQEYIRGAVRQWSKGGDPEDPLFDLTDEDITINRLLPARLRRPLCLK